MQRLLTIAILLISISLGHAYMSIWSPRSSEVLYHADNLRVSWACTQDDNACQSGIFELTLWQKTSVLPSVKIATLGQGNPFGVLRWPIPESVLPGDYYYIYAENNSTRITVSSSYFSIRHMGFNVHSPSLATVWTPNMTGVITWSLSGLFDLNLAPVVIQAYSVNQPGKSVYVGATTANAGKFYVDTTQIPWESPTAQGPFFIRITHSADVFGTSAPFFISPNRAAACSLHSAAALFSHQVYGIIDPNRIYESCGRYWNVEYAYSVSDNAALIVASPELRSAIVSFRGTTGSITDWINTLSFSQIPCTKYLTSGCNNGNIHAGFANSFNFTAQDIRHTVGRLLDLGYNITLTGHSKGAAIATIQALDLFQAFPESVGNISLVTFGSPRVGDDAFAKTVNSFFVSRSQSSHTRYVNSNDRCGDDPVTQVPPRPPYPYYHAGNANTLRCPYCLSRPSQENGALIPLGVAVACHGIEVYKNEIVVEGQGVRLDF